MKEIISYGFFCCREMAPHKNRGMEITYVAEGMLDWMVEGRPESLTPGTIFFTLPWQAHGSVNPEEPPNRVYHVLFHLEPDALQPCDHFRFPLAFGFSQHDMIHLSRSFCRSHQHAFPATPALQWLMPELVAELQEQHELRNPHAITLLRGVLVELSRLVRGQASRTRVRGPSEARVRRFLDALPEDSATPWKLDDMAARCGLQRSQFSLIVQRLTGSTPMEYLFRVRMERAKTLLRDSARSITDISFECGFGSSQYFASAFRRISGLSPTLYRRRCRDESCETVRYRHMQFRSHKEELQRIETFSATTS